MGRWDCHDENRCQLAPGKALDVPRRQAEVRAAALAGGEHVKELAGPGRRADLSGVTVADQASSMYLVELALDMASQVLKPKGSFLAKVFQGEGYDEYLKSVRAVFDQVVVRKPDSSRSRSREVYILGKGFKG